MRPDRAARRAPKRAPGIPRDDGGPVFREPWEAQAFAMALALCEQAYSAGPSGQQPR